VYSTGVLLSTLVHSSVNSGKVNKYAIFPRSFTSLLLLNWIIFTFYRLLVSMAPLSKEIRPISSCMPPHLGPAVPEVNTVWFKLFIYHLTGYGPPSLLLSKGMYSIYSSLRF
jgi:hypothetical protein